MIRWLLAIFVAVIVFSILLPGLEKIGIGRLPGDVRITIFGKTFLLPFTSTLLIAFVVFILVKI